MTTRIETDSFGPIEVEASRYWGAQTQRSLLNFPIGNERMPLPIIHAFGLVKATAANTNMGLVYWIQPLEMPLCRLPPKYRTDNMTIIFH